MGKAEQRLIDLGLELPAINPPQGSYLPFTLANNLIFVSGQGPRRAGELIYRGTVGADLSMEEAQEAAKLCALNILAQLQAACCGELDRIARVLRLAGLVRCTADFTDQAKVLNAASDLICLVLDTAGPHARIAAGTNALPSGMAVEIEAIAEMS
ncbi:MAG: RidA family protein [Polaromonas sp.]|nr:RidA family protein [Polaromonas sp.]